MNESAVLAIFEAKRRPLSDPLIVHVLDTVAALKCVDLAGSERAEEVFATLTQKFWPGPLTLVCPARPDMPKCLSAGTNTIGVRSPSHLLARKVLEAAAVPIAAPSANLFGHVSPTSAKHVLDDLGDQDIAVLNGEEEDNKNCEHGIESTVCKIEVRDDDRVAVVVYRRGALARHDIEAALLGFSKFCVVEDKFKETPDSSANCAPGQLLTHYAPRLPSFLVSLEATASDTADIDKAVVVDFQGRLQALEGSCLAYRDLSPTGDAAIAAADLFTALRWAEDVPGAVHVFIADLSQERFANDLLAGVADRLYRAASGRHLKLLPGKKKTT